MIQSNPVSLQHTGTEWNTICYSLLQMCFCHYVRDVSQNINLKPLENREAWQYVCHESLLFEKKPVIGCNSVSTAVWSITELLIRGSHTIIPEHQLEAFNCQPLFITYMLVAAPGTQNTWQTRKSSICTLFTLLSRRNTTLRLTSVWTAHHHTLVSLCKAWLFCSVKWFDLNCLTYRLLCLKEQTKKKTCCHCLLSVMHHFAQREEQTDSSASRLRVLYMLLPPINMTVWTQNLRW